MSDSSDSSSSTETEQKQAPPAKGKQKKFRRIVRQDSSSSESDNEEAPRNVKVEPKRTAAKAKSNVNSSLEVPLDSMNASSTFYTAEDADNNDDMEIPPTDSGNSEDEVSSEDDEVPSEMNRTRLNHQSDDDAETEDEDLRRKTIYEAESDEEEKPPVEDEWVISKATRKSINPLENKIKDSSDEESSGSDNDIVENSDEEEDDEVVLVKSENSSVDDDELEKSAKNVSNEVLKRESMKESFNDSIPSKFSSTLSKKDASDVIDLSDDDIKEQKTYISKTQYAAEVAKKQKMEQELNNLMRLQEHTKGLPDGGQKLQVKVSKLVAEIELQNQFVNTLTVDENLSVKSEIARSFEKSLEVVETAHSGSRDSDLIFENLPEEAYLKAEDVKPKHFGKVGLKNFETKKALTVETLQEFHNTLKERPNEDQLDEPPKYLKIELMKHQLHAVKFMRWREEQKVKGGILADDMGLGKTLTTISLILKQIQLDEAKEEDSSDDSGDENGAQWKAKGRKDFLRGGTLVICPASLIKQWESEIKEKVRRGALDVTLFHGPKRIYKAKELSKYDVVITSYQTIASEFKNEGCAYSIKFRRIVLDEGHVIRNHKTQQSKAVCELHGERRWVLSGTPVQNKEFDLYAVIKFLRCQPFDDLTYWKNFVESRDKTASSPRVQALLKSILLRRTKEQLILSKEIDTLPEKSVELVNFSLNQKERYVYNRLMSYSQTIFAQYLSQNQEKNSDYCYDQTRLQSTYKAFARKFKSNREIKNHEILVLLLRLRQSCCHPALIRAMVERAELQTENGEHDTSDNHDQSDIVRELEKMNLNDDEVGENAWSTENEVFDEEERSSKMQKLLDLLRIVIKEGNKAIIVSQWVSHLNIVKQMLSESGIRWTEFNGSVAVKNRNDIVTSFNDPKSRFNVMLLSLSCGGVGLNLIGANVMFIIDLHWNPQLEQQGQDRIYRFGQKKNVKIYKFICTDTIEERILAVQNNKMEISNSALTGEKTKSGNKLTLNELKSLFDMH